MNVLPNSHGPPTYSSVFPENTTLANSSPPRPAKPPLLWTGILFAFAANMLLVTGTDLLVRRMAPGMNANIAAAMIAPLVAGAATAFYVKRRGGIHAVIGGILSTPPLALIVFEGFWQPALFAGAFCGLAGACMEIVLRRRRGNRD